MRIFLPQGTFHPRSGRAALAPICDHPVRPERPSGSRTKWSDGKPVRWNAHSFDLPRQSARDCPRTPDRFPAAFRVHQRSTGVPFPGICPEFRRAKWQFYGFIKEKGLATAEVMLYINYSLLLARLCTSAMVPHALWIICFMKKRPSPRSADGPSLRRISSSARCFSYWT